MHGPQVQRDTDELEINLNRWLLRKLTRRYRSQRTDPLNPNIAQLNGRRKLIICSRHQDHSVHNSGSMTAFRPGRQPSGSGCVQRGFVVSRIPTLGNRPKRPSRPPARLSDRNNRTHFQQSFEASRSPAVEPQPVADPDIPSSHAGASGHRAPPVRLREPPPQDLP